MAKENEVVEKQPATVEEARAVHNAKLDTLVAAKKQPTSVEEARVAHSAKLDTLVASNKARSRRHAQFLVNAGELKLP